MKKIIVLTVCFAVLAGGVVYGLPYFKIYQIVLALQEQDRERLVQHIDFPRLRLGIKEQIRAGRPVPEHANGFEKIGPALMDRVLDNAVDQLVTPEGLATAVGGYLPALAGEEGRSMDQRSPYRAAKITMTFFRHTEGAYASPAVFIFVLRDRQDSRLKFLMDRRGLTWRLSRIEGALLADRSSPRP